LFIRARLKIQSTHTVYSRMKILSIVRISVNKQQGYGYLKEIVVKRANQKEYILKEADFLSLHLNDIEDMFLFYYQNKLHNHGKIETDFAVALRCSIQRTVIKYRVEDLQLGLESYQTKLNLIKPQVSATGVNGQEPFTIFYKPKGTHSDDGNPSRANIKQALRHCNSKVQAITKHSLLTDLDVFERAEVTLKHMGIWLCGVCFKTHTLRAKCRHRTDFVPPPDNGDGVVHFVLYDLTKPQVPFCSEQLDHVEGLFHDQHGGVTLSLLDSLFSKGLCTIKSIPPKCRLGLSRVLKGALDKRRLVSKVSAVMIGHSLDGYLNDLQFGIGVSGGGEGILHAVNRMIEDRGDDVSLSMLLMDLKNAFNLVDRKPNCTTGNTPYGHAKGCSRVILLAGWPSTFFLSVTSLDMEGSRVNYKGWSTLCLASQCGPVSVNFDFSSELVLKRVSKTIGLMDAVTKINDPQCELLLLRACTWISKLYFVMRTCPPCVFESAQRSFDVALYSALERIVTAFGPKFDDWQWRLATLPFAFWEAWPSGPTFDDALCVFNASIDINLLSNPSEIVTPKLMKKIAGIYFTRVTKNAKSTFSLSPRQMAIWKSQREDLTSDWLRVVLISWLGETMKGKTYPCVLCYRLANMLLYSWDGGLDVCVDLTGSSPLTQTGMAFFMLGRAVIDAAQCKRVAAGSKEHHGADSQMHNNIMAAGSKERPPMLALGRYA
nr:PAS domain-containing protein tyrosine kinase family protein [Tanacetum cinerariifolium]